MTKPTKMPELPELLELPELPSDTSAEAASAVSAAETRPAETRADDVSVSGTSAFTVELQMTEHGLALVSLGAGTPGPVVVPWAAGGGGRQPTGIRNELIARAAGLKSGVRPVVWDLTAGLGRDAFVLAALGCPVLLVERSPQLHAMLADALIRLAASSAAGHAIASRMTLCRDDARNLLQHACARSHWVAATDDDHCTPNERQSALELQGVHPPSCQPGRVQWAGSEGEGEGEGEDKIVQHARPDVICLDPMYPHRTKQAAVKKEMRVLRAVVGDDEDAVALLPLARALAVRRVVVKRPRLAPQLDSAPPDVVYQGNHTRFDVYLSAHKPV